jgi:histidinol-phosphate aminotransferase
MSGTHTVCTNGGHEAIDLIVSVLKAGSKAIICPPTYSAYAHYLSLRQIDYIEISRNNQMDIDIEQVERELNSDPSIGLLIIDSPSNPTGNVVSISDLRRLLSRDILVVVDEEYFEYSNVTSVKLLSDYPNLMILRSFSKWAGLAGVRLSYILGNQSIVSILQEIKSPYSVSSVATKFGEFALDHKEKILTRINEIKKNKEYFLEQLGRYEDIQLFPSNGPYIIFKIRAAEDLLYFMLIHNIRIKVLHDNTLLDGSVRLSIPLKKDINYFLKIFELWLTK